jgi:uncharacterized protein with HEPN domain
VSSRPQREADWLADIVENAQAAESYVAGLTFDQWKSEQMRIDAVERCLMRLTEAAIRIGETRMAEIVPDTPMHQVRGLGNLLRHAYDGVDPAVVWATVVDDLPVFRAACERAMGENG